MEEVVMDLESAETSAASRPLGVAAAWDTVTAALVSNHDVVRPCCLTLADVAEWVKKGFVEAATQTVRS